MVVAAGSTNQADRRAEGRAGAGNAYLPALDGLRAVSILLVVLSHLGLDHVVPGAFGVTLFFFISGFLITRQLAGGLARQGRIDFAGFYLRRALRLMPAGLAYVGAAGGVYAAVGGRITAAGWLAAIFYGANYYDLWVGYHSTLAEVRHPFNILWSLAIEEHFYALWPACLLLVGIGRRAAWWVLALCVAVLVWRVWLWGVCFSPGLPVLGTPAGGGAGVCGPVNPNPLWRYNRLYLATDTRVDSIAWGAILALAPAGLRGRPVVGVLLLGLSFAFGGPFARHVVRPSLQGVALLALVPWVMGGAGPMGGAAVVQRALCSGGARWLGRLSYSLYLWHWGALGVADYVFPAGGVRWVLVAAPLSLGLAMASYTCIERPMLRLRRRFGSHVPAA
jgi:peptidoglycan/LPS O-acetylase OafA/YrhL